MKELTKKEALEKMRDMWNWIADETEKRKDFAEKREYFDAMRIRENDRPRGLCYACEYADVLSQEQVCYTLACDCCIIDEWAKNTFGCEYLLSPFQKWQQEEDWKISVIYAHDIAKLAEDELEKLKGE